MGYEGPHPLPVKSGASGAATLTGLLTGNGTSAFTGNTITQYGTLVAGASNAVSSVAPSATTGLALCSNGSSSNPSFQSPLGANLVFLSSQTASASASVNFTSLISATYQSYLLIFYNVYPATNAQQIALRFSTDNGGSYIATNYLSSATFTGYNSTTVNTSNSTTAVRLAGAMSNVTSNASCCGFVYLNNLQNGGLPQVTGGSTFYSTTVSLFSGGVIMGMNTANTNINAFQILAGSGNIAQGTFTLYGIKES